MPIYILPDNSRETFEAFVEELSAREIPNRAMNEARLVANMASDADRTEYLNEVAATRRGKAGALKLREDAWRLMHP